MSHKETNKGSPDISENVLGLGLSEQPRVVESEVERKNTPIFLLLNHTSVLAPKVEKILQNLEIPPAVKTVNIYFESVGLDRAAKTENEKELTYLINDAPDGEWREFQAFYQEQMKLNPERAAQLGFSRVELPRMLRQLAKDRGLRVQFHEIDITTEDPEFESVLKAQKAEASYTGLFTTQINNTEVFRTVGDYILKVTQEYLQAQADSFKARESVTKQQLEQAFGVSTQQDLNIVMVGSAHIDLSRQPGAERKRLIATLPEELSAALPDKYQNTYIFQLEMMKIVKLSHDQELSKQDVIDAALYRPFKALLDFYIKTAGDTLEPAYRTEAAGNLLATLFLLSLSSEQKHEIYQDIFNVDVSEHGKLFAQRFIDVAANYVARNVMLVTKAEDIPRLFEVLKSRLGLNRP